MLNFTQLTPDSSIGDLPAYKVHLDIETLGRELSDLFEQQPILPGIVIIEGNRMVGLISRRKFLERMSQPYSLELYLKRPVRALLEVMKHEPTRLPGDCKIEQAAQIALTRPAETVYEPIVVVGRDKKLRVVDVPVLLLAQNHIMSQINRMIQQQKDELDRCLHQVQQEQARAQEYAHLLEIKQAESQERNRLLESQQSELINQAQQISDLNQRFIKIGQLLSLEGKKAFQATFEGVEAICQNTDHIISTGKSLARELETVQEASRLIEKVSKQARYLAVQAAVIANQTGGQFEGFSRVTNDISQLVSQTFEAARQTNETVTQFRFLISELTKFAQQGAGTAQSLIEKTAQAEIALLELEQLVSHQQVQKVSEFEVILSNSAVQTLVQKIQSAGAAIKELEEMAKLRDVQQLIQKVDQPLKYGRRPIS
ncbi:hypothetical protein BST81_17450 [Leptolyngbya sp. 'hensonii']|uniref:hypothetical protein n=1 Tax=Leptolyngbya sp. 'hensonii' TaxID=1922337 RepID=UPI00094FDA58|nr:hypothetical protein [Leptolyngbya sp. 'hensonii']OLP17137.1 hypothetical protein BST81_17450 [Leptolyngbya sp. 'hensonii']